MAKSNTILKDKCNGRHPGCICDIEKEFPVICSRFSIYGNKDTKKFKPIIKNGRCVSYNPNELLIKVLNCGNPKR